MTRDPAAAKALPPLIGAAPPLDPADAYLDSLAPGPGRTAMRATIHGLARAFGHAPDTCPWPRLRAHHLIALRTREMALGRAPATINKSLCALRQIMRFAHMIPDESGRPLLPADALGELALVRSAPGRRPPPGRALDPPELAALLGACDDGTTAGARDHALIALLAGTGLRRAEAAAARIDDYDARRERLRVHGKGQRTRFAYPAPATRDALEAWIARRTRAPGPLLCPVTKAGTVRPGAGLTGGTIAYRLTVRAAAAGIAHCSPHDLRRTYLTRALLAGMDLAMVQALAGHASPTTTARYDRRPEAAREAAARRLDLPEAAAARAGAPAGRRRRETAGPA